ncbi:MAG: YceD family protein [Zoogloeaceae bacterium]|jgi:uncharacterized protein|nr:YceD family protein [Zoogloeaceae bacterium]
MNSLELLELARRRGSLSGRLRLDALPRLADVLCDASGSLDYAVSGETAAGRAFLTLRIEGVLPLVCQRCLGPVAFALNARSRIMLIEPGAPWPEDDQPGGLEDETCDAIEASRELDLAALLEEEIILALPLAPRHAHCQPPAAAVASPREASPFAQLARLKRG